MKKDLIKKCLFLAFLIIVITVVIAIIAKYNVEGEQSLPYSLEKILIVSRVDTINNEDPDNLWNISLTENNNIFVYIKKDKNTDDTIKEITLINFKIHDSESKNIKIYRPTGDLKGNDLYKYSEQDYLNTNITYTGSTVDTLKNLEIANTGGMLGFRVSLENIGNYVSNNHEETIVYDGSLITKAGLTKEDISFKISFDLIITLNSNVSYKGTITLDLPNEDILTNPESYLEITDFNNVVFKRI